jgi:hypothetical protein
MLEIILGPRSVTYRCPFGHSFDKPRYGCCPTCGAAIAATISQAVRPENQRRAREGGSPLEKALIYGWCYGMGDHKALLEVMKHTPKTKLERLPIIGRMLYRRRCRSILLSTQKRILSTFPGLKK